MYQPNYVPLQYALGVLNDECNFNVPAKKLRHNDSDVISLKIIKSFFPKYEWPAIRRRYFNEIDDNIYDEMRTNPDTNAIYTRLLHRSKRLIDKYVNSGKNPKHRSPDPSENRSLGPSERRSPDPSENRSLGPSERRSLDPSERRSPDPSGSRSLGPSGRRSRSLSPSGRRSRSLGPSGSRSRSPIRRGSPVRIPTRRKRGKKLILRSTDGYSKKWLIDNIKSDNESALFVPKGKNLNPRHQLCRGVRQVCRYKDPITKRYIPFPEDGSEDSEYTMQIHYL